jgi:hypothetical protein
MYVVQLSAWTSETPPPPPPGGTKNARNTIEDIGRVAVDAQFRNLGVWFVASVPPAQGLCQVEVKLEVLVGGGYVGHLVNEFLPGSTWERGEACVMS